MISLLTLLKILGITLLFIFILLLITDKIGDYLFVWDYADVEFARPCKRVNVISYDDIRSALLTQPDKKVSIAGAKFSHGGQTFDEDAIYLDMINCNNILMLDRVNKIITVQAGATWRQVLEFLDKYNLSVKAMQSYANFTVGGTISVNAHGRGIEYSTVGSTLIALKVMLADGRIIDLVNPIFKGSSVVSSIPLVIDLSVSEEDRDELFRGVLGGYGGIAVILEATLSITDNYLLKRVVKKEVANTTNIFDRLNSLSSGTDIDNNSSIILYNGLIYPERSNELFNIYYEKVDNVDVDSASMGLDRLQVCQKYYWGKMIAEQILRRSTLLKYCRAYLEPIIDYGVPIGKGSDTNPSAICSGVMNISSDIVNADSLVFRNWELSYDTNTLASLLRFPTTSVLQEYFIPINPKTIEIFFKTFNSVMQDYAVNLLNISLRYVRAPAIQGAPILNYAPSDRLAIVIYYNLGNNPLSLRYAEEWTQKILDVVVGPSIKGSYYLPYLPFASLEEFRLAYPNYERYLNLKKKWDPNMRLSSQFIRRYLQGDLSSHI